MCRADGIVGYEDVKFLLFGGIDAGENILMRKNVFVWLGHEVCGFHLLQAFGVRGLDNTPSSAQAQPDLCFSSARKRATIVSAVSP